MRSLQYFIPDAEDGSTPLHYSVDPGANRKAMRWPTVFSNPNTPIKTMGDAYQQYTQQEMRNRSGNYSGGITASPVKFSGTSLAVLFNSHILGGMGKQFGSPAAWLGNYWGGDSLLGE